MTEVCIEQVKALMKNEVFAALSVEQLLYAAIAGVGGSVTEVQYILDETDWTQWPETTEDFSCREC